MSALSVFLIVLLVSGSLLLWEARTGRLTPRSAWGARGRGVVFFSAAALGAALLFRTAPASPLLAAALVPVTLLSAFRLLSVMRTRWRSLAALSVLALALALGVRAGLSVLPKPLDQRDLFELIFHPDGAPDGRSIDPGARRVVRA